ncbi:MAG: bifunctional methylenetetrahydrofolate dehydrogenase/methenyltetrahydrofolate cyclohydrolase FolD [Candidatus Gracilibacteria bacterium]|nr:bifunctional methylenetetrahydrofolate dehydrogenase/methenyltetrahydrofolate cyclohydrolase FolD [Candidatus Gracilibacteria bacterium]
MPAQIIDGKKIAKQITEGLKKKVAALQGDARPGLAVVRVGDDPASVSYVNSKEKKCKELGYYSVKKELPEETSEKELLKLVAELNADPRIHGILVQLPLPKHISEQKVLAAISPEKDVDGFHPMNLGRLLRHEKTIESCTPKGIIKLIKSTGIEIAGKNAVVVGRSNIVGKPVAALLLNENATVTICHSKTTDLTSHLKQADIVVVAVGQASLITGDMLKKGAVVIDVGTNRLEDGKLHGDVDFESAEKVAGFLTPVPGGVGPMTIACLMENTYEAFAS